MLLLLPWLWACGSDETPDDTGSDGTPIGDSAAEDSGIATAETGDSGPTDTLLPLERWAGEIGEASGRHAATRPGTDAGRSLDAGDLDGDGLEDIVVATASVRPGGGALILPGPASGEATLEDAGHSLVNPADGWSGAGRTLGVGDATGDGVDDLLLGTPYGDPAGALLVLGPVTGDRELSAADGLLVGGSDEYSGHGTDLADVTGDGQADAIVGGPGWRNGRGIVYLLNGPLSAGEWDLTVEADAVLQGESEGSYTAKTLHAGGDLDGDGVGDLLIPAVYDNYGAPVGGSVHVVHGPVEGTVALADSPGRLVGHSSYDMAGFALAFGDVDGDGLDDALIASPRAGSGLGWGSTYLVLGPATGVQDLDDAAARVDGTSWDQKVQDGVDSGDVDLDGFNDVLLGAPQDATVARSAGGAFLFYGPLTGVSEVAAADAWLLGETEGDELGQGIAVGHVGGGPGADLLMGATGAAGGRGVVSILVDGLIGPPGMAPPAGAPP